MEDKRVFERIQARLPLRFLDPSSGRDGEAQTVDVSANGVGFITKTRLAPKTALEMWLELPDQRDPIYMRGQVVWSLASPDNLGQRVGISLENARLMTLARVLWLKEGS